MCQEKTCRSLPPYHAWTPLSDLPARSRSAWLCELFFAGQKRPWWGPKYSGIGITYSQGVRQAVFAHYANRTGWCVSRSVKKGLSVQRWQRSRFCLAPTGGGFGDRLTQAMRYGCVPPIIQPIVTQPLEDILPYETFSLRVGLDDVPGLPEILGAVSRSQHASLLREGCATSHRCSIGTPLMAKPSTRLRTRCVAAPIARPAATSRRLRCSFVGLELEQLTVMAVEYTVYR